MARSALKRLIADWTLRFHSYSFPVFCALLISVLVTFSALTAEARGAGGAGHFGLGLAIGEPSAITGKYWLDGRSAVDFGVSFNLEHYLLIYSDYDMHWPGAFGGGAHELAPYLGIGGIMIFSNDRYWHDNRYYSRDTSLALGLRIPLGIEWLPRGAPIGVFAEIAPGLTIIPATWGFFTGAIGARFYF
jgi:hypothetical protein